MSAKLMPLVMLAQELRFNVLTVSHLNKGESQDPMSRVMGARAFVGVARSAWRCSDDNLQGHYAHIMAPIRGPKGRESFRYHTEVVNVEIKGEMSEVIKMVWDGVRRRRPHRKLSTPIAKRSRPDTEGSSCVEGVPKVERRPRTDVQSFMKEGDLDISMCADRVRATAGVRSFQKGRKWYWGIAGNENMFEKFEARKTTRPEY